MWNAWCQKGAFENEKDLMAKEMMQKSCKLRGDSRARAVCSLDLITFSRQNIVAHFFLRG